MHNAVERRYRNSINDRIVELDNLVPLLEGQAKKVIHVWQSLITMILHAVVAKQQVDRAGPSDRVHIASEKAQPAA